MKIQLQAFIFNALSILLVSASAQTAQFDWFEYEGRDAVFSQPLPAGHFQNPILAGFYPDPSITRAGDTFYMVHSSFSYFPGIPIFKSTDLIHWQPLGHVLTRRSQLQVDQAGVSRGIFAPTIRYHDGTFYVISTGIDDAGGNFIVTAKDPAGPWSELQLLPEIKGIDPDIFFDDDGKVYIAHNGEPEDTALYEGHRAIWLWEYDLEKEEVVKNSGRVIVNGGVDLSQQPIWIEAPHIYKINGWYYLLCAEGGTEKNHSEVVFRTKNLAQPFIPYTKNPILTQRDLPADRPNPIATAGHADLVQTPSGQWWAVFLATRNYNKDYFNTGRETFLLPVSWTDDWPIILPPGQAIPWQLKKPVGLKNTLDTKPLTGNFTWRDDFNQVSLSPTWNILRSSSERPYQLAGDGYLKLQARQITLDEKRQPGFVGRRQQHLTYEASTQLQLPLADTVSAGITVFQSEMAHYFFALEKQGSLNTLVLEMADQSQPKALKRMALANAGEFIRFKISGNKDKVSFLYQTQNDKKWQTFAHELDATLLSTKRAGGFVGTYLGLHSRTN